MQIVIPMGHFLDVAPRAILTMKRKRPKEFPGTTRNQHMENATNAWTHPHMTMGEHGYGWSRIG